MSELGSDVGLGLDEVAMLIERGNLDAAQSEAQALLLRHPNSAAVHAVLGDVAAARHQHREAIEWYELSLRLEATTTVRERLERERDRLDAERLDELEPPAAAAAGRRLLLAGIAGGAVLLILIIALAVGLSGRNRQRQTVAGTTSPPRPVGPTAGPVAAPAAGAQVRPATRAGAAGPGVAPVPAMPRPINQTTNLRVTQSIDAPMADRDILLTRALAALTWSSGEELGWRAQALMDPFTGYAMISVEVPPGMRGGDLYPPVIDMAYRLAVAAIQADRGIDTLTVRVLTPVVDDRGRSSTMVAFRGNTSREALDYYLKRGIQPDAPTIWSHVFATTWWNPSVPAGSGAAATGQSGS